MNLLHLEHFYEVAKAGSVSVGARKLRLSQPAVSKSIRLLEENMNTRLFERTKRGMHLTSAGRIAFDHAGRIFSEARKLADRILTEKEAITGEWCLGASDNLAVYLLPKALARLKRRHPELVIQVFSGASTAIKEELYADRCEAGLFFTPPSATENLRAEVVSESEFWIVLGADSEWTKNRKGGKKAWTLADLRAGTVPRIESRHKDYTGGFPAHFHSRKLELPGGPYIEANLHEVKKRLVLEGAGYALLIRHSVEAEVKSGALIRIPTPTPLRAPIYWVTRKGRATHRANDEFLRIAGELGLVSRPTPAKKH
jgi:DNA-binding transcriptional LysR family regulator